MKDDNLGRPLPPMPPWVRFYKGSRLIWYSGRHLQCGLYVYEGEAPGSDRHKIRTIRIQEDGFFSEFQVDGCDIRLPTEAELVLFK